MCEEVDRHSVRCSCPSLQRFQGALLGALVGDVLGAEYEGRAEAVGDARVVEAALLERLSSRKMVLRYTDDTAMTRSVCASLLACKGVTGVDLLCRFVTEYFTDMDRGYGAGTSSLIYQLRKIAVEAGLLAVSIDDMDDPDPPKCPDGSTGLAMEPSLVLSPEAIIHGDCPHWRQPAQSQYNGAGSSGNGAAMRAAPLGLFYCCSAWEDLRQSTAQSAAVTHAHADGLHGAVLVATAVALAATAPQGSLEPMAVLHTLMERATALEGKSVAASTGQSAERERSPSGRPRFNWRGLGAALSTTQKPYCGALSKVRSLLEAVVRGEPSNPCEVALMLGTEPTALHSVPLAIFIFLRGVALERLRTTQESADNGAMADTGPLEVFSDAICFALACGGDTDTIASMSGAMLGAYLGSAAISKSWIDVCEGVSVAETHAEGLLEAVRQRL